MNWSEIKKKGSSHYKGDKIEPIDLIKEGGLLWDFALASIIKYAYRNRKARDWKTIPVSIPPYAIVKEDLNKIIHYAEMLKVLIEEEEIENRTHQCDKG